MKSSKSSNTFPVALIFLFRGHPTLRNWFYRYSYSYPMFEQPIFRRSELCSVISEGINDLIRFAGNRINVANHL
ncbi:hypothetical protein ES703_24113 [subsurface metagenome]